MTSTTKQFISPTWRAHAGALRTLLAWVLTTLMLFGLASQRAASQTIEPDPPSRVARLSELSGNAWLYRPDTGEWVEATRNLPVTTGDTLATEAGARVELQVGSSTIRLDSGSELQVSVLDDSRISLQLRGGALAVRVRNLAETGPFDVTTDDGRFLVAAAGRYRFDHASNSSFAAVDSGQVRYEFGASALTVNPGQRAEFWIDANGVAQYGLGSATYDAFTAWNNERDRATERGGVTTRYVSPEMTGVEDLDRYGNWEQTPDYGAVWIPAAVSADWVPYSAGRWAWVRPWGWTWVDDAPWGFAPFHYGRWVNLRNRWCWTPGVREPRPIYAPALVGWIAPPRGGASVGGGYGPAVGWFPLAPREVFVPGYRGSPRYIRGMNTPHMRRGDNIDVFIRDPLAPREFENRRDHRAVTVVPATAFTEQRRSLAPVAAQFRDTPWARDFASGHGQAPVAIAAPVTAPPSAVNRQGESRPMRPPPGFPEQRAAGPGRPGRDRDAPRSEPPMPVDTGSPMAERVRPLPVRPSFDGGQRAGLPGAPEGRRSAFPSMPAQQQQPQPQPQPQQQQQQQQITPLPSTVPEVPRVRPLPMGRGGDRREEQGRFGDERSRFSPGGEPGFRPNERAPQPSRPDAVPGRAEVAVPRPPEMRAPAPMPPVTAPIQAPRPLVQPPPVQPPLQVSPPPPPPPPPPAAPAPVQRPIEAVAPPRRVEGPRPAAPAAEPQRPAVPERRNAPESTR